MEVAASIITLISAGVKIVQCLERIVQGTANAPILAQKIKFEIAENNSILSKLHDLVHCPTLTSTDREFLANSVAGYSATFTELEEQIQRLTAGDTMDIRDRLHWAWAESTIDPLMSRLQDHKRSLTLIVLLMKKETSTTLISNTTTTLISDTSTTLIPDSSITQSPDTSLESHDRSSLSPDIDFQLMKRPAFETTLFSTRPYRRIRRSESELSALTFERPVPRWSFYSAESDIAVKSLPAHSPGPPSPDLLYTMDSEMPRGVVSFESRERALSGTPVLQITGEEEGSWWVALAGDTGWWKDETPTLVSGRDAEDGEEKEQSDQDFRSEDENGSACPKEVQVAPQWP